MVLPSNDCYSRMLLCWVMTGLFAASSAIAQIDLDSWTKLSGKPGLYKVAWAGTQFIGVGAQGRIATSPDGENWTTHTSGTTESLFGVAWSGSRFVAVGYNGTILMSLNGSTWTTTAQPGELGGFLAVAWGGDQFIAVGRRGVIVSSPDGVHWVPRSSGTAAELRDIAWNGRVFVAVGRPFDSGPNSRYILTSADGMIWTPCEGLYDLYGLLWTGTQFVAVGYSGTILTSPDGAAWTSRASGDSSAFFRAVAGDKEQIVIVGTYPPGSEGLMFTSSTGVTWTRRSSGVGGSFLSVAYNGSRFVVANDSSEMFITGRSLVAPTITVQPASQSVSAGASVDLSVVASGEAVTYQWRRNGVDIPAATKSTLSLAHVQGCDAGIYTVMVTNGAGNRLSNPAALTVQLPTDSGKPWDRLGAVPSKNGLCEIASDGRRFVLTGAGGTLLSSDDGVSWTVRAAAGGTQPLSGVTWKNGLFVAVGGEMLLTSVDGLSWISRPSGLTTLHKVAGGAGQLVAVGYYGLIATSTDGTTWVQQATKTQMHFRSVAWNGSQFVALGWGVVMTSPDGIHWTERFPGTRAFLESVVWGDGRFVAVGYDDNFHGVVLTSADGVSWTNRSPGSASMLSAVTWTGGRFVAVGGNGLVLSSSNGEAWTTSYTGTPHQLECVTSARGLLVAGGEHGTIYTSPVDGSAWVDRSSGLPRNQLLDVIWNGTQYVVVGVDTLQTSVDGVQWTSRVSSATGTLCGVAWSGLQFAAVGPGVILTSPDGITWTKRAPNSVGLLSGITHGNGRFIAVRLDGRIMKSTDGVSWATIAATAPFGLLAVTWNSQQFVAVGTAGGILTSGDGENWTQRASGTSASLFGVTSNGGRYVAVGDRGTALTSVDGISWARCSSGVAVALRDVTWTGQAFIAVGEGGVAQTSSDGTQWSQYQTLTNGSLYGVARGGPLLLAVGSNGTIASLPGGSRPTMTQRTSSFMASIGGAANLLVTASGPSPITYQWRKNGTPISGANEAVLRIVDVQLADVANYDVLVTNAYGSVVPLPAALGVSSAGKVVGGGIELDANIPHSNGRTFDQVLMTGPAEAITADWQQGQITRTSFLDLDGDIVQVEFAGPGTLALVLDDYSPPARPARYNQQIDYVQGHAGIVITGADERTNVSVFTVGRATAFDRTGAYNFLLPPSTTNDPAKNGSPLFDGHGSTDYDGIADLAYISIQSRNGKFGGVRTSNAHYFAAKGYTGLYAPGVNFQGPVFIGDITASDDARPVIILGSASDVRITGGELWQRNSRWVEVQGITRLKFTDGQDSHGRPFPALLNQAILLQHGRDVTSQIVVNP